MDKDFFVHNVKMLCLQKGVKPTNACKECGVGGSFLNDVERGRIPSVEKFQALANYLGVTTSQLLGENTGVPAGNDEPSQAEMDLLNLFRRLDPDQQDMVIRMVQAAANE